MSAEKLMLAKTSMFFHHRLLDVLKADILPFWRLACYQCILLLLQAYDWPAFHHLFFQFKNYCLRSQSPGFMSTFLMETGK